MIFNSLGSNYSFKFAFKFLKAKNSLASEAELKQFLKKRYGGKAWLYYRGRAALSEAVRLCQADYVLSNSFSCYAVEQAIRGAGSQIVFADVNKKTHHFSLKELKHQHKINPKIKAIIVQNTFGISIKIKPILNYCRRHNLYLIEDLAHCPDNQYADGTPFGTVGDLVVLSFGRDKQIDVVNGGALIGRNLDLVKNVIPPKPIKNHWYQRSSDRLYPLFICFIRFCYFKPMIGKVVHRVFKILKLVNSANEGSILYNAALPSYRSQFILEQFENIKLDQKRRQQLVAIYDNHLAVKSFKQQGLLRYPVLMPSAVIKSLAMERLAKDQIYLNDNWYDDFVYPARLSKLSSYQIGQCVQKEKIIKKVVNLPLHKKITPQIAQSLIETLSSYSPLHFKTKFNASSWHNSWQQFDPLNRNLLTSWQEGEALKIYGQKVWRLGVYRNQQIIALVLATLVVAKRGRFLKVSGNPLFGVKDVQLQNLIIKRLRRIARREKCVFIRMHPYLLDTTENRLFMEALNLKISPTNLNAPHTLRVDLAQPIEKILSSKTYKNTRYNINLAKRLQLRVVKNNTLKSLDGFLNLLQQTQKNQDFLSSPFGFIKAQFKAYTVDQKMHIYQVFNSQDSENPNELLAGAIIVDSGQEAAYLYGASSKLGQKLKAPYILQWQIILEAKSRGMQTYNLWGISPPDADAKHRFKGLTRFKKNFTAQSYSYLPTYDLVLKKLRYLPNNALDTYETKKRHL